MTRIASLCRLAGLIVGLSLLPTTSVAAQGQSAGARLIEAARADLEALADPDSAIAWLGRALAMPSITRAERIRAFTILGAARLAANDRGQAQQAFEQALRLDGTLRADSLEALAEDFRNVFVQARIALGIFESARETARELPAPAAAVVEPPLALAVRLPADTTLSVLNGFLEIAASPNRAARVILVALPMEGAGQPIWRDTLDVGEPRARWGPRAADGAPLAPGRYTIRAFALDVQGRISETLERSVLLGRMNVDTLAHPAPLAVSAPETRVERSRSTRQLATGLGMALAAVALPSALGNAALKEGASYPTSYAVAATVSAGALIGYFRGRRQIPIPENVRANATSREVHAAEVQRVRNENERRRREAPLRVQTTDAPR